MFNSLRKKLYINNNYTRHGVCIMLLGYLTFLLHRLFDIFTTPYHELLFSSAKTSVNSEHITVTVIDVYLCITVQ